MSCELAQHVYVKQHFIKLWATWGTIGTLNFSLLSVKWEFNFTKVFFFQRVSSLVTSCDDKLDVASRNKKTEIWHTLEFMCDKITSYASWQKVLSDAGWLLLTFLGEKVESWMAAATFFRHLRANLLKVLWKQNCHCQWHPQSDYDGSLGKNK